MYHHTTLIREIKSATTLDELLSALLAAERGGVLLTDQGLDDLPLYGGDHPDDTTAIWSWDADRLLVGIGSIETWEIVDRTDFDD